MIHIGIFKIFYTWAKSTSDLMAMLIWKKIKIQIEKRYKICQMSWLSKVSADRCQNTHVGLWVNNKGFKRMLLHLNQLLLGLFINFIKGILNKAKCYLLNKKLAVSMFFFTFWQLAGALGTRKCCLLYYRQDFRLKKMCNKGVTDYCTN